MKKLRRIGLYASVFSVLLVCCLVIRARTDSTVGQGSSISKADEQAIQHLLMQVETDTLFPSGITARHSSTMRTHAQEYRGDSDTIDIVAAGIRNLELQSLRVENIHATVHFTFTAYSHFKDYRRGQPTRDMTPSNKMIGDASLVKINGSWHVVKEEHRFVPGSEP